MADDPGLRQAYARLRAIAKKLEQLSVEQAEIEAFLADRERFAHRKPVGLRKNSLKRLRLQSLVRTYLQGKTPQKASSIYDMLRAQDGGLKPATFRSHLQRMVEAGHIEHAGPRGLYKAKEMPHDNGPAEVTNKPRYLKASKIYR